jgi:hypothetical protein
MWQGPFNVITLQVRAFCPQRKIKMDCGNRSFFYNLLVTIIVIVIIIVIDKNQKITSAITQPASTALIIINIYI